MRFLGAEPAFFPCAVVLCAPTLSCDATLTAAVSPVGGRAQVPEHLLPSEGVPQAHPPQGDPVQDWEGLQVRAGEASLRSEAEWVRWSDQARVPQEGTLDLARKEGGRTTQDRQIYSVLFSSRCHVNETGETTEGASALARALVRTLGGPLLLARIGVQWICILRWVCGCHLIATRCRGRLVGLGPKDGCRGPARRTASSTPLWKWRFGARTPVDGEWCLTLPFDPSALSCSRKHGLYIALPFSLLSSPSGQDHQEGGPPPRVHHLQIQVAQDPGPVQAL